MSQSIIIRLKINNTPGSLSKIISAIGELDGNIGAIDIVRAEKTYLIRDISITTAHKPMTEAIIEKLKSLEHTEVLKVSDSVFLAHLGGKIEIKNKIDVNNRQVLSMVYTPGVADVCMDIHHHPENAKTLTIKKNTVAVITDGSAVLGLGNIGPLAGLPVMEGKAMLFKGFADVDAWPICLDTQDTEEIIRIVKALAPGFGGINLEDISAPRCFEIEERLQKELDIPVFHDDQHGTAVVMTAAFINALKVTQKDKSILKVVVSGIGAAGTACTNMLLDYGVKNIIGCDSRGAIYQGREGLNSSKELYASKTNPEKIKGTLKEVLRGADVFVGVSAPNIITGEDVKSMNANPIVFAMSNPDPEIDPEVGLQVSGIFATGRSDYPNQINNVLCFPGIFRGALDCRAPTINEPMKLAAAHAIADTIPENELSPGYIIPSVFNKEVAGNVARAVVQAAVESGLAKPSVTPEED